MDAGTAHDLVDEVVVSNCLGLGGNLARLTALETGLKESVAGLTIDRQCCGGLDALLVAEALIKSGRARMVLAGGAESHSLRPACYRAVSGGYSDMPVDQAPFTPWPHRDPNMNEAAGRLARELGITKEEQDAWAVRSHQKARRSRDRLRQELASAAEADLDRDEFTRNLSLAVCGRARGICGPVTAANMAVAADGAAMCLLVPEEDAAALPRLKLIGGCTLGGDPERPGIVPVSAIRKTLGQCGLKSSALSVAEIMEAYAVQAIACARMSEIDPGIINPGGGALARGHPVGASGAVLAVRMFHELCARPDSFGLSAIAAAGGLGTAALFQSAGLNAVTSVQSQ